MTMDYITHDPSDSPIFKEIIKITQETRVDDQID
jgi:hypothetical protein